MGHVAEPLYRRRAKSHGRAEWMCKATSTLDKPGRGTPARFLADLQLIPNLDVQPSGRFAERRCDTRKGPLCSGMSHPEELEGGGGLWTSQYVPVLLLHSSILMGGWRRGPSTPSAAVWDPGVVQARETGTS